MTDRAREIAHKHTGCWVGDRVNAGHMDTCDALTADIVAYGLAERADAIGQINKMTHGLTQKGGPYYD